MRVRMKANTIETQLVGFLDTNVLHFVSLYLQFARTNDLFPLEQEDGGGERVRDAVRRTKEESERGWRESLQDGLGVVYRARKEQIQIRYASVSELELMAGRMRGRALLRAADEGLPERMWTKFREEEIRRRLSAADATAIMAEVDSVATDLKAAGVLVDPGDTRDTRCILELAKTVTGLIYLQPADCIIFSAALVAQADELYTTDGYLRGTVNRISNPQGSDQQEVKEQVTERLASLMGWAEKEVTLPTARKIRQFLPPVTKIAGSTGDARLEAGDLR